MSGRAPSPGRLWRKAALVWLALTLLLGATIVGAYLPIGDVKLVLSLGIAAAKAILVMLVFMELWSDTALIRTTAVMGLLWLGVFFALTLAEEATRQHALELFVPR
jgi:cytochrome c oxidase subunit 4